MGKKDNIHQCKTAREITSYAESHGGQVISQSGSHVKVRGPVGTVTIPNHPGDLATGTRCSIIKTLLRIGILALFLLIIVYPILQACFS